MADTPITWPDVVLLASDMADVTDVQVQDAILEWVNSFLNPSMFTTKNLKKARIYLAAHVGSFSFPDSDSSGTSIESESVGGITRTYGAIARSQQSDGLDSTTYGMMYQLLLRTSKARLPRVI